MLAVDTHTSAQGRVLVVDDDPTTRSILRELLTGCGHEVLTTTDGHQGVALARTATFDTVVLDVVLPDLSGFEVCRRLRALPATAHVPVVFLTATRDKHCARRAREAGGDDVLLKPFDRAALLARVHHSVRQHQYQEQLIEERNALQRKFERRTRALAETSSTLNRTRKDLEDAQYETLQRLSRAAEFRDDETGAHLQRISHYSRLLAQRAGHGARQCELIKVASTMHDVGKVGVPDDILLKPGKLTGAEFEIMKQHPEIGYRILSGSPSALLTMAAQIAYTHHERWDGTGYPRKLAGPEIPIEGRITAVVDVFDALTSARPYKPAWTNADALDFLHAGRGLHFDPRLVDLFTSAIDEVVEIQTQFRDVKH